MTALGDIYNAKILELAAAIPPARRLEAPDATATAHSKLCGSTVTVDLRLVDHRVEDFGLAVKACLLGQASSSVMARQIVGSSADELRAIGAEMRRMLKERGAPPGGRWSDLGVLEPVRDVKARHTSTLLVFEAVERALAEIEARAATASA